MDSSKADIAQLDDAINRDDREEVRRLLSRGVDPNARDVSGVPVLASAAWIGSPEMVELLLSAGADPLLRDSDGLTALERLVQNTDYWDVGHDEVMAILEELSRSP